METTRTLGKPVMKGSTFSQVLAFVEERFGNEALDALLLRTAAESLETPVHRLSVALWYPTRDYIRLLEITTELLLDGRVERCCELGAWGIEHDLRSLYPAFLQTSRVEFLVRAAPLMWQQYNGSGELRVLDFTPGRATLSVVGYACPSEHEWYVVLGSSVRTLELAQVKEVGYEIREGIGDGSANFTFVLRWRDA